MKNKNPIIYDGSLNGAELIIYLAGEYKGEKNVSIGYENFFIAHLDAIYSNGRARGTGEVVALYQVEFPLFPDVQSAEESWKAFERRKTNMGLPSKIWKNLAKIVGLDENQIDERVSHLKKQMIEFLHEKYFSK